MTSALTSLNIPCNKTRNRAFIHPEHASPQSIRAAKTICGLCPVRVACATAGLSAGNSLDGSTRGPANDVIVAGIICRGDTATARVLAQIAGVEGPQPRRAKRPRGTYGTCKGCDAPLVAADAADLPAGHSRHHARSYGTCCRSIYSRLLNEGTFEDRRVTEKPKRVAEICRHCHQPLLRRGQERTHYWQVQHSVRGVCVECTGSRGGRRSMTFNEHACVDCEAGLEPRPLRSTSTRCPQCADRRLSDVSSYRGWWMRVTTPVVDDAVIALAA